jgi:hypothetical protein
MRVWALASYGSILALTACSAQESASPPEVDTNTATGNDAVRVENQVDQRPEASRLVSEPEVGRRLQRNPQLSRTRLNVSSPSPTRYRSEDLRARLERIRAQRQQVLGNVSSRTTPQLPSPTPAATNPNAKPRPSSADPRPGALPEGPQRTSQQVITPLNIPDRPLSAVPQPEAAAVSAQPSIAFNQTQAGEFSLEPQPSSLPLHEGQEPQPSPTARPGHRGYSAQHSGNSPDLTPPAHLATNYDNGSAATVDNPRNHLTARLSNNAFADLANNTESAESAAADVLAQETYDEANNRSNASPIDATAMEQEAAGNAPDTQLTAAVEPAHRHHRASPTISLSPTGNGSPQLHSSTVPLTPRFSTLRGTANPTSRQTTGEQPAVTTTSGSEPRTSADILAAITSEIEIPASSNRDVSRPEDASHPDSLPLHSNTTVTQRSDLSLYSNSQGRETGNIELNQAPQGTEGAIGNDETVSFSETLDLPAEATTKLPQRLAYNGRNAIDFSDSVRLPVPVQSDQSRSTNPAHEPSHMGSAPSAATIARTSASDMCDRSRLTASLLAGGKAKSTDHLEQATADHLSADTAESIDKLCSGATNPLAQSNPEAATAGTPIPGNVESPTR